MTYYDFKEYKIGDIAEIISGGTPKTSEETYWGEEISWITPKDLSSHKKVYIEHGARSISKEGLHKSSAKLLPAGTVLLSTRAPIGYVAIAKREMTTNQGFKNLVLNENFDNHYIYYLLSNSKEYLEGHASGTTFKELSANTLKNIRLQIPNIEAQRNIGKILYTIDKKIELNSDLIKNLESMGNLLFKHLFIDFEFPNEEGQPYKSSGGKMVESELGLIPESWKVGCIGEYSSVYGGFAFKSKWWAQEGIKVAKIKDISSNFLDLKSIDSFLNYNNDLSKYEKYKLKVGDLLIAMTGATLGKIGIVPFNKEQVLLNQRVGKFELGNEPLKKLPFLYCLLSKREVKSEILHRGSGSAQSNISSSNIERIKVVLPPEYIVDKFNSQLYSSFKLQTELDYQNTKLIEIRNALLPKLLSGEIEVPVKEPERV